MNTEPATRNKQVKSYTLMTQCTENFYVLLTVHLSISLDSDQRDARLLYFTICPLQSSTCFEHYMLIRCTGRPLTGRTIPDAASIKFKRPDDEHVTLETC